MNFAAKPLKNLRFLVSSLIIIIIVTVGILSGVQTVQSAIHATYIVDDSGDDEDANPGNGSCATTEDKCTLRAAIEEANERTGPDIIEFDASIYLIRPDSALPDLNDTSGGTTIKTDYFLVINGSNIGGYSHGLTLVSNENKIQDLAILEFYYGFEISGDSNQLSGNTIGGVAGHTTGVIISGDENIIGANGDGSSDADEGNIISGNTMHGIYISGDNNWVAGNYIGTNASGSVALANGDNGVVIGSGTSGNVIGTNGDGISDAAEGNLISGNSKYGIKLENNASNNVIAGNMIGTDAAGESAIPNGWQGIIIYSGGIGNRIGTDGNGQSDLEERNIISGNESHGITLIESDNNIVAGNYIGTNASGDIAIPNEISGVSINSGSSYNRIGMDPTGQFNEAERNLISGNMRSGVLLTYSGTWQNKVAGNYIGINAAGDQALGNDMYGVEISAGANTNYIGAPGFANVVAGNGTGIFIYGNGTLYNQITHNLIGTKPNGLTGIPNSEYGIHISEDASNSYISHNRIAFNTLDGIFVQDTAGSGNGIQENEIFSNGGLGIDLAPDGVNTNDDGDTDSGPNDLQNYPEITAATTDASSLTITGTVNTIADQQLGINIEFFASPSCDPSGYGEGKVYLGENWVSTDSNGDGSFVETFAYSLPGYYITATANPESTQNTSEFSECILVEIIEPPPSLSIANRSVTEEDSGSKNAVFTVTLSEASTLQVSASYATADSSANAGHDYTAKTGILSIPAGDTEGTISIPVLGDTIDESDETFTLTLSSSINASISDGEATGTIKDNDDPPSLNISDASVTEGDSGTVNMTFPATLSNTSGFQVSVDYATANGTAKAGSDYTATSGKLTFNMGEKSKTITVPVSGDLEEESDETFTLSLSQANNATILDGEATGTIQDNDGIRCVYLPLLAR